jgi:hypothetical protein
MTDAQVEQIIAILKAMGLEVKQINAKLPLKEIAKQLKGAK